MIVPSEAQTLYKSTGMTKNQASSSSKSIKFKSMTPRKLRSTNCLTKKIIQILHLKKLGEVLENRDNETKSEQ